MELIINILIASIVLIHCYILWFEMFAWNTRGKKVFKKFPPELFEKTKVLAANQGLYNGFLAAGLIWTFFIDDIIWKRNVSLFFLACVTIAGIFGALTADKKIIFIQSLPALLGILLLALFS